MYQREKAFLIKTAYLAAVLAVGWLILRYALVWLPLAGQMVRLVCALLPDKNRPQERL